jgi:Restriction endonuclease/Bacterial PH domain
MICVRCGAQQNGGARYCPHCGQTLSSTTRASRGARRVEVVTPLLLVSPPSFLTGALRPGEVVLASLRATARPNRRRASSIPVVLVLTNERVLYGSKSLFSHSVEELAYQRVTGVSYHRSFLSTSVDLRTAQVTLTARLRDRSDPATIDRIIAGRKSGVVFTLPGQAPSHLPPVSVQVPPPQVGADPATPSIPLETIDPLAFEELTRQLLERMGYQARLTKASHDGGIDIEAFDPQPIRGGRIVVQCKKYSNVVGVPYVRDLYGVVQHEGATKGILITTSHFSPDARAFAQDKPLELIERHDLEELLRHYGLAPTEMQQPSLPVPTAQGRLLRSPGVDRLATGSTSGTVSSKTTDRGAIARVAGYGTGALCIVAGLGGDPQGYVLGLGLIALTLLGSNAWGMRSRVPILSAAADAWPRPGQQGEMLDDNAAEVPQ